MSEEKRRWLERVSLRSVNANDAQKGSVTHTEAVQP
jgi:hypothetical protein